jgi:hypothetical protein
VDCNEQATSRGFILVQAIGPAPHPRHKAHTILKGVRFGPPPDPNSPFTKEIEERFRDA